jgi:hypothetical protein
MASREYMPGENEVKYQLRKEVSFGCPICRNPILVYHHFDPEWSVRHHWDRDGVICLCVNCHLKAKFYTKDDFRRMKVGTYSIADVKEKFPWTRTPFIVRVGGSYCRGSSTVLKVNEEPVIEISTGEEGLLFLSFNIRSKGDRTIAKMKDNVFEMGTRVPADLRIKTDYSRITVLSDPRKIAIDVSALKITRDQLDGILRVLKKVINKPNRQ